MPNLDKAAVEYTLKLRHVDPISAVQMVKSQSEETSRLREALTQIMLHSFDPVSRETAANALR